MSNKVALVIYATLENDMAKVYRALGTAQEFVEAGDDATIVFDGSGVEALAAMSSTDNDLNGMLESLRPVIAGACGFCAKSHGVEEAIVNGNWAMLDGNKGHASIRQLVVDGYTVLTF